MPTDSTKNKEEASLASNLPYNLAYKGGIGWFFGGELDEAKRDNIDYILHLRICNNGFLVLIMASVLLLVFETNAVAERGPIDQSYRPATPLWILICQLFVVFLFIGEALLRIYVARGLMNYIKSPANLYDFVVITLDFILTIMDSLDHIWLHMGNPIPSLAFLRFGRAIRLLRMYRVMVSLPQLKFILDGFFAALSATFWGLVVMSLLMLVISVFAVDYLNPVCRQAIADGYLDEEATGYYASVWNAIQSLTVMVVIGDDWGDLVLPLVKKQWWVYHVCLTFYGLINLVGLNLILASIVDSGQKSRDDLRELKEKGVKDAQEAALLAKRAQLLAIFKRMDDSETGYIGLSQLQTAVRNNTRGIRQLMLDIDVEMIDVEIFFRSLDEDETDSVPYQRLVDMIFSTKNEDSYHMISFTKYATMALFSHLRYESKRTQEAIRQMNPTTAGTETHSAEQVPKIHPAAVTSAGGKPLDLRDKHSTQHVSAPAKAKAKVTLRNDASQAPKCTHRTVEKDSQSHSASANATTEAFEGAFDRFEVERQILQSTSKVEHAMMQFVQSVEGLGKFFESQRIACELHVLGPTDRGSSVAKQMDPPSLEEARGPERVEGDADDPELSLSAKSIGERIEKIEFLGPHPPTTREPWARDYENMQLGLRVYLCEHKSEHKV